MLETINIFLFLIYSFGFGYALTRRLANDLETNIMRIGIGLAAWPVLGILLNVLHIPLDWRIFLVLALALPLYDLSAKGRLATVKFPKPSILMVVLFLTFAVNVYIYCHGAFSYPWLEDDDSWGHAAGIKYISIEKNLNVASGLFHYINPYPPGYDLIFGVLHQTNPSLYWTLKFFNGFIISLGFLFFYVFAKDLTRNKDKALLATILLSMTPCYLSHFIWAHSLLITLFFPALYLLNKARREGNFLLPASLVIAGMILIQPTQTIKFLFFALILFLMHTIINKNFNKSFIIILLSAGLISLLWWLPVLDQMRSGTSKILVRQGAEINGDTPSTANTISRLFGPNKGTATRSYTWKDYILLTERNLINSPVGLGPFLSLLAILGIFFSLHHIKVGEKEEKVYLLTVLGWSVFTFLGMNTMTFHLPIGLFAFRFWLLFAIPVALLAAEAVHETLKIFTKPFFRTFVFAVFILSVVSTSGYMKYRMNTGIWPWGVAWTSIDELMGYVGLRMHLPPRTKVFTFKNNLLVIGCDMDADYWRKEYQVAFQDAMSLNLATLHRLLKEQRFQYLILGQKETEEYGLEAVNNKLNALRDNNLFKFIFGNKAVKVFKIL